MHISWRQRMNSHACSSTLSGQFEFDRFTECSSIYLISKNIISLLVKQQTIGRELGDTCITHRCSRLEEGTMFSPMRGQDYLLWFAVMVMTITGSTGRQRAPSRHIIPTMVRIYIYIYIYIYINAWCKYSRRKTNALILAFYASERVCNRYILDSPSLALIV